MSFIGPILGAGHIYNGSVLRGNIEVIDFEDAITRVGIELQFYSNSGELIGVIGSNYEKSHLVNLEIELNKIGHLKNFKFTLGRIIDKPFYNDMEVRFYNNTVHWFTGLLTVQPGQGRRDITYEFEGKGFFDYAKRITVNKLYQNETVEDIVIDLIEELASDSRVLFNPDLIDLPSTNVVKLELKNKTIEKGLKEVLKIVNTQYKTIQYRYGVNKNREFFFVPISTDILKGFFEGWQMQEPDVEEDISDLVNSVTLYRAQEDSQVVEKIATYTDTDSIDTWGLKEHPGIVISDYVDSSTAALIANSILSRFSDPVLKIECENIKTEDFEFDFGFYEINTKRANYINELSDFESLGVWDLNILNTVVTLDSSKTISKNQAFKAITAPGSEGEYMEFELEKAIYFPLKLIIYVSISIPGDFIDIIAFDDEGNSESLGLDVIKETEDGEEKITEQAEDFKIMENTSMQIDLAGEYFRFELNIATLNNVKKVRIVFVTDEIITFYFDRLDLETFSYKQYEVVSDTIKYSVSKAAIVASMVLGEETTNLIQDLKKLNDKSENILDIFKKS